MLEFWLSPLTKKSYEEIQRVSVLAVDAQAQASAAIFPLDFVFTSSCLPQYDYLPSLGQNEFGKLGRDVAHS